MSEEAINQINERLDEIFYELIDELKQENQQLKEEIQDLKADYGTIAQIERDFYKEVIEEVREVIDTYKYVENDDGMYEPILDGYDIQKLLQILDKAKENK